MNKDFRVSVQLTQRHYDYVKKLAEQTGNSISGVIRGMIIEDMYKKQK